MPHNKHKRGAKDPRTRQRKTLRPTDTCYEISEALLFPPFWSEATYNKYLSVEILIFETRNGKNKEGWNPKVTSPQLSERDKNYSCINNCITTLALYATGVPGPKMAATPAL